MLLPDVGAYLQAQGLGTLGVTIFLAAIPEEAPGHGVADALLALYEIPGLPPARAHDTPPARYEQPRLQVIARGAPFGYQAARVQAQAVWDLLDGISNTTLGTTEYLMIQAVQSPLYLRTDVYDRPLISCTYQVAKEPG